MRSVTGPAGLMVARKLSKAPIRVPRTASKVRAVGCTVMPPGRRPDCVTDPAEVASIHLIPLADLTVEDAVDFVTIPESDRKVVRFRLQERLIHAPTAALLYQFREVLAGRVTRVAELEQPTFAWR